VRRDAPAGRSDTRVPSGSLRTGKAMLGTRAAAARTTALALNAALILSLVVKKKLSLHTGCGDSVGRSSVLRVAPPVFRCSSSASLKIV
jgi:hypothetical protein